MESGGSSFCSHCGHRLTASDRFCPNCGVAITPRQQQPAAILGPAADEPATSPSGGIVQCHGCGAHWGAPGALCPGCGSRLRDPSAKGGAIGLGIVGAVLIGLAIAVQYVSEGVAGVIGVIGFLSLLGAGVMASQYFGRVGPEKQQSCCGCTCAVALLVLPAAGSVLWIEGDPLLAALVIPAWIPLSWAADVTSRVAAALLARMHGAATF